MAPDVDPYNFNDEAGLPSEPESGLPIFTFDGDKGDGKTTLWVGIQGSKGAFSYDNKVRRRLEALSKNDPSVHLYDAIAAYRPNDAEWNRSAAASHDRIVNVLRRIQKVGPLDYIVHDGLAVLAEMEEHRMRHKVKIGPFDMFANLNFWKHRKLGLREIFFESCKAARKGVIFVTDIKRSARYVDGREMDTLEPPNWYDIIEKQSDVWIRCHRVEDLKARQTYFYATIQSSKIDSFPTGQKLDVTGVTLSQACLRDIGYDPFTAWTAPPKAPLPAKAPVPAVANGDPFGDL